ncbi:MAG TPA: hybrid sensor histidine kinase/response regulator [Chloroflexota bacterium]|nr:hybrid sensor histidine kinase/response regulator [Chloroflexota bacterium]
MLPEAQGPTTVPRILVVDDNEDLVEMLSAVLTLEGYEPLPAYNGADAIQAMQETGPDLVLLDRALPDLDGLEVCSRIKSVDPSRFLPVIMVTAAAHRDDKLVGLARGVDDYITKPFDMDELVAKVRVMLRIKATEDKLRQRTEELARLHEQERQMVIRLTELDQLKSQFIATASHELRTPLSIIKGFTNLLTRRDDFGFDRDTEMQYLGLIDSQVNALTSLVDDMLSASRIESGRVRLQRERVELLPMIRRHLGTFIIAAAERKIEISLVHADPAVAYADSQQAEQVFVNLVSNAIKYSYDGGKVRIWLRDGPEILTISVADQGVGIARDQMDQLFSKFTRLANPRSVEAGGTGLGLFIARNWVEANGGRIWAESEEAVGSTFSFTLPRFREG